MTLKELCTALSKALDLSRIRRRAEALTANGVFYGEANFAKNAAICEGYLRESGFQRIETIPITPRRAARIRERLAAGEHLVGHGVAATRVGDGFIRTVTGVIPGKSRKEVILCAHIYEPFIPDDDAGAAQAIEVATDFRACYEEVLRGPDGCANCPILPRHI